jgi:hypothetical protein
MQIDHANYPLTLRSKSDYELHCIARDAYQAERANPTGEKAGYYLDEINYVANELHRRRA